MRNDKECNRCKQKFNRGDTYTWDPDTSEALCMVCWLKRCKELLPSKEEEST